MKTTRRLSQFSVAFFSLSILLFLPSPVLAQRGPEPIVGTWQVSIAGGPPGNISFTSFHADWTMSESSVADVLHLPVSSPGYGVWAHTQANQYTFTFKFFIVGPGPDGYCTATVRSSVTLNSADQWSGLARLDCTDSSGNELFFTDLTTTATRMHLEALN